MIKVSCAICKKELEKPGAIILSPPHDEKFTEICDVTKFHICCDCYSFGILQFISNPYNFIKTIKHIKEGYDGVA